MSAIAMVRVAGKSEPWRYAGRPHKSYAGLIGMDPPPPPPSWLSRLIRAIFS